MTAVIGHNYSNLDHQHEIFIVCNEVWVWFYLGAMLQKEGIEQLPRKLIIYPHPIEPSTTETITFRDCEKGAERIVAFIKRKIKQPKSKKERGDEGGGFDERCKGGF